MGINSSYTQTSTRFFTDRWRLTFSSRGLLQSIQGLTSTLAGSSHNAYIGQVSQQFEGVLAIPHFDEEAFSTYSPTIIEKGYPANCCWFYKSNNSIPTPSTPLLIFLALLCYQIVFRYR